MVLYATVEGHVQGVGFRAFARDSARRLDLSGYVRNMPDGRVYVAACGERAMLEQFLELLRRGPSMARVSAVRHEWADDAAELSASRFEVQP